MAIRDVSHILDYRACLTLCVLYFLDERGKFRKSVPRIPSMELIRVKKAGRMYI